MGKYVGDKPYDFAVTVYDGKKTADKAFDALKDLEDAGKLKIHDAAVFTRKKNGKIKLKNKGYIATWKGGTIGLGVGLLLGGPVGGALVGGLIGFGRGNDRRNLRGLVNDELGPKSSALAVVAEDVDWAAVEAEMAQFEGVTKYTELQGDSLTKLEELAADDDVTSEVEEDITVVDAV